ncbi:c-Myc-binding protein-like isoform X2 [Syngnathus acus]|uniref:c-Myc-binding protein-like isoform X2 n=1 Tax=Syngnathus acus TaxID=161584 RepID=UPI001885FE75|nr:c-Myc-binding protein-like isoform X2 [Syngnathus acus]
MAYKKGSIMSERVEFRRYLEQNGVLDALTNAMTALYNEVEKPDHAMDFLKRHIIALEAEALASQKAELEQKCQVLTVENQMLRSKLMQYEPSSETAD